MTEALKKTRGPGQVKLFAWVVLQISVMFVRLHSMTASCTRQLQSVAITCPKKVTRCGILR